MLRTVFFFFKQKTAYEMRISDWSSDVCSSDLGALMEDAGSQHRIDTAVVETVVEMFERADTAGRNDRHADRVGDRTQQHVVVTTLGAVTVDAGHRKSVVSGKRVSGRVDLGGRRIIKKKHTYAKPTPTTA